MPLREPTMMIQKRNREEICRCLLSTRSTFGLIAETLGEIATVVMFNECRSSVGAFYSYQMTVRA